MDSTTTWLSATPPPCCCAQLRKSSFIDAERLLKVVPHNQLLEVQALLHKHLGDHREALRSNRLHPCTLQWHPVIVDTLYAMLCTSTSCSAISTVPFWQLLSLSALLPCKLVCNLWQLQQILLGCDHCVVVWIRVCQHDMLDMWRFAIPSIKSNAKMALAHGSIASWHALTS